MKLAFSLFFPVLLATVSADEDQGDKTERSLRSWKSSWRGRYYRNACERDDSGGPIVRCSFWTRWWWSDCEEVTCSTITAEQCDNIWAAKTLCPHACNLCNTVVDILGDEEYPFSELEELIELAKLDSALRSDGPFTVMAPTNDVLQSFIEDNTELIEKYQERGWSEHLRGLLKYHVFNDSLPSSAILDNAPEVDYNDPDPLDVHTLLEGSTVAVEKQTVPVAIFLDRTFPGESEVVIGDDPKLFDLEASNGYVHAIDAVLLPEFLETDIAETATKAGFFSMLLKFLGDTGLDEVIAGGDFTVFAPTDEAFEAVDEDILEKLGQNTTLLTNVLLYHVVGSVAPSRSLWWGQRIETALAGAKVEVKSTYPDILINEAKVIAKDILASNGIIHVIDEVLLPPSEFPELCQDTDGEFDRKGWGWFFSQSTMTCDDIKNKWYDCWLYGDKCRSTCGLCNH